MKKMFGKLFLVMSFMLALSPCYSAELNKDDLKESIASTFVNGVSVAQAEAELQQMADSLLSQSSNTYVIKEVSQLGPSVGGFYELDNDGTYRFDCGQILDLPIKLTKAGGNYTFESLTINCILSYTGSGSMIQTTASNIVLNVKNLVLDTPNSEAITMANGNSLILTDISLGLNCLKVATVTDTNFLTCVGFAMVACQDGITCTNVGSVSATNTQWSSGADAGGSAFKLNGTANQALFTIVNYTAETTENMIYVDNAYTGTVNIANGAFRSNGGNFFDPTGKDQTDIGIDVVAVARVSDSGIGAMSNLPYDALRVTAVGTQFTRVKLNASDWNDSSSERITTNANGTWTYIGLEKTTLTFNAALTVDPDAINQKLHLFLAKNGVIIEDSLHEGIVNRGGIMPFFWRVNDTVTGDYFELYISNETSGNQIFTPVGTFKIGYNYEDSIYKNCA